MRFGFGSLGVGVRDSVADSCCIVKTCEWKKTGCVVSDEVKSLRFCIYRLSHKNGQYEGSDHGRPAGVWNLS